MEARIGKPVDRMPGATDALPAASLILVTGGTGTLGRLVVARLRDGGCDVRVLSSREGGESIRDDAEDVEIVTGDLATAEGIEAAVEGSEIVVHGTWSGSRRGPGCGT